MIKILSASQTKALDAYTIQHEPIASIDLMERAGQAFVNWFVERYDASHKIGILCGTGNNGGDGLAIARLLKEWNYQVKVWIVNGGKESSDFSINHQRLNGLLPVEEIIESVNSEMFNDRTILIDAIFGTGLTRSLEGIFSKVITALNQAKSIKISVDVPSGLFVDQHSDGEIFRATHTVSFQLPKLAFFMPENSYYVGDWHVVDIGLSKQGIHQLPSNYQLVNFKSVRKILHPRNTFDHKGKFGHALLIAGSHGKMGACILSAQAVLRSGIGLLTAHIPRCGYSIIQTAVPEAMVVTDESSDFFSAVPSVENYTTIGVGPGIGKNRETVIAVKNLLEKYRSPMVLDADALNIMSENRELLKLIPSGSILTPHPKEFERLTGGWANDFDRLTTLKQFAQEINSVIILKGAFTAIATPESEVYFNSTGNPGMATAGSGDVLTGIVTGLLAQGYDSVNAAILAVYVHGLAGDIAAREKGMASLIARDLLEFLPNAFKKLG